MVLDPMGVELATIDDTEDVALAFPTRARLDEVRASNPSLTLRRFSVAPVDSTSAREDS
jgi:hypothetical protein